MSSLAELESQKQVFTQAYEQGKISQQEYAETVFYTQMQINKLRVQQRAPSAPLPVAGTSQVAGSWKPVSEAPLEARETLKQSLPRIVYLAPVSGGRSPATKYVTLGVTDPFSTKLLKGVAETEKMQADPLGYVSSKVIEIGALATGLGAPAVAVKGAVVGLGITQAVIGATQGRLLTPHELRESALAGAAFSGVGTAVYTATGVAAMTGAAGVVSRAGVSAGITGAAGYVLSGGDIRGAAFGAAFGAGLSVGGEALGYVYPRYIKPALGRVGGKIADYARPERAMIRNALREQSTPKTTFTERITGQKTPTDVYEKLMYKHVTNMPKSKSPMDLTKPVTSTREIGVSYKTPSGWAQQSLIVKEVTQKVGMKPWVLTTTTPLVTMPVAVSLTRTALPTTKTAQKQTSVAKQIQREMVQSAVTQQVAHPFLVYKGAPYYRTSREREDYEVAVYSYPYASPLTRPTQFTSPSITQYSTPFTREIVSSIPIQAADPFQDIAQTHRQTQYQSDVQVQTQKQVQDQVQELTQATKLKQQTQRYWPSFGGFDAPAGFSRMDNLVFGKYGRYKRWYPIMTAKQMLKEVFK